MVIRKALVIILCICCVGWMTLIHHLSTQDGQRTADTGMTIARQVSKVIYKQPTEAEINDVHMKLRKAAHVILFFVFGLLVGSTGWLMSRFWKQPFSRTLIFLTGLMLIIGTGWLDEWQKQFIGGRHYQQGEAFLNIVSGMAGGGLVLFMRGVLLWLR